MDEYLYECMVCHRVSDISGFICSPECSEKYVESIIEEFKGDRDFLLKLRAAISERISHLESKPG